MFESDEFIEVGKKSLIGVISQVRLHLLLRWSVVGPIDPLASLKVMGRSVVILKVTATSFHVSMIMGFGDRAYGQTAGAARAFKRPAVTPTSLCIGHKSRTPYVAAIVKPFHLKRARALRES